MMLFLIICQDTVCVIAYYYTIYLTRYVDDITLSEVFGHWDLMKNFKSKHPLFNVQEFITNSRESMAYLYLYSI